MKALLDRHRDRVRATRAALLFAALPYCVALAARADTLPQACASMVAVIGAPEVKGDRSDRTILCRLGYVLSHDNERRTPNWVVERLTPDRFKGPADRTEQGNPFAADPDLKKGQRAELTEVSSSPIWHRSRVLV